MGCSHADGLAALNLLSHTAHEPLSTLHLAHSCLPDGEPPRNLKLNVHAQ